MAVPEVVESRMARGRAARQATPRSSHGIWSPAAGRPDPIAILEAQGRERLPRLLPIRYGRMAGSPLAFFRGAAAVMASDLASTPVTGQTVQASGDAHLANFGVFATAEGRLLFDLDDFDETLPGPWEWDLKRLATSVVLAATSDGFAAARLPDLAATALRAYRDEMRRLASQPYLQTWYARLDAAPLLAELSAGSRGRPGPDVPTDLVRDNLRAEARLTETVDGRARIKEDPPLIVRDADDPLESHVRELLTDYQRSLDDHRRHLLDRYQFVDIARKTVGVGSVGTRCSMILLHGTDAGDPLFLQIKEAEGSVLEPHLRSSRFRNQGQRVVEGQRLVQAAGDIFLGWMRGGDGRDYYLRQLYGVKRSFDPGAMDVRGLGSYAAACGTVLAHGHARSGDAAAIAGYIGSSDQLPQAIAGFAIAYAEQTERDHATLLEAIQQGRLPAENGV
jgi:uncharacterized protein (DUF2252 family)